MAALLQLLGGLTLFVSADASRFAAAGLLRLMGLRYGDDLAAQARLGGVRFPLLAWPVLGLVGTEMRLREAGHDLAQKGGAQFPAFLSRRIRGGADCVRQPAVRHMNKEKSL